MTKLVPVHLLKFRVHADGFCILNGSVNCFVGNGLSHPRLTKIRDNTDDHVNQSILDVSNMTGPSDTPFQPASLFEIPDIASAVCELTVSPNNADAASAFVSCGPYLQILRIHDLLLPEGALLTFLLTNGSDHCA